MEWVRVGGSRWGGNFWGQSIGGSGSEGYVGGDPIIFFGPGSTAGFAKWNGTNWTELGPVSSKNGFSTINAITVDGTVVYIGGYFDAIAGVPISNIAEWDGSTWSAMGAGT